MRTEAVLHPDEVAVVNQLQSDFPLAEHPFALAAERLEMTESDLLATVASLLQRKVLSRFGPLYQVERMGGQFVLAALEVPEARIDEVAAQLHAMPAVAHNYLRTHRLNMWCVLATATPEAMQQAQQAIVQTTGLPLYAFPKCKEYYVGMRFTVGGEAPVGAHAERVQLVSDYVLTESDWQLVRATQAGLPVVTEPYQQIAQQLGWSEQAVYQGLERLLQAGVVRRVGVVPNHYAIGYRSNGMAVFDVDDALIDQLGVKIGALDFVTHCYQRPRHGSQWPYNLFAMCHGNSQEMVHAQVAQIRALLGAACRQSDVLFSTRILKKTGVRL